MPGFTIATAGDNKVHSVRELGLTPISEQRVTVINAPLLLSGSAPTNVGSPLNVGINALEICLASGAAYTYHHSDPTTVVWNDLGEVLALSVIWSPDTSEAAVIEGPV